MKFDTESFIESVITELKKEEKINADHVYTMSWSSSGPWSMVTPKVWRA